MLFVSYVAFLAPNITAAHLNANLNPFCQGRHFSAYKKTHFNSTSSHYASSLIETASVCTRDLRLGQRVVETNGEYFSVKKKKPCCIQCKCKWSSVICCFAIFGRQSIRRKRSPSWPSSLKWYYPVKLHCVRTLLSCIVNSFFFLNVFQWSIAFKPRVASCVNFSIRGQLGYYSKALQL